MSQRARLALLATLLCSSCAKPALQVELQVKGAAVDDVYFIAGTDKLYWPHLGSGETRRFQSKAALPAELTVLYRQGQQSRSSTGPEIAERSVVEIVIDTGGREPVSYRVARGDAPK